MLKLEIPEQKLDGKMELATVVSDLMPAGKPDFLQVVKYPKIVDLVKDYGRGKMQKILFLMVKDFCSSTNVVRNMNEEQMIEAAAMLIDEADNFRLEDYTMFFSMAKRGMLIKIYDRINLQIISDMLDEYWIRRRIAACKMEDAEISNLDSIGTSMKLFDDVNPQDVKLLRAGESLVGAIGDLKNRFKEWKDDECK